MSRAKQGWRHKANPSFYRTTECDDAIEGLTKQRSLTDQSDTVDDDQNFKGIHNKQSQSYGQILQEQEPRPDRLVLLSSGSISFDLASPQEPKSATPRLCQQHTLPLPPSPHQPSKGDQQDHQVRVDLNSSEQLFKSDTPHFIPHPKFERSRIRPHQGRHFTAHFSKPHLPQSSSIDQDDTKQSFRHLLSRTFRPNLRRAISDARYVYESGKPTSHVDSKTQALYEPNKPISSEVIPNKPRTFDSSILEIPIDIRPRIRGNYRFDKQFWPSCDLTSAELEYSYQLNNTLSNEVFLDKTLSHSSNMNDFKPSIINIVTNNCNNSNNNNTSNMASKSSRPARIRRMNTTAVDHHYQKGIYGNSIRNDSNRLASDGHEYDYGSGLSHENLHSCTSRPCKGFASDTEQQQQQQQQSSLNKQTSEATDKFDDGCFNDKCTNTGSAMPPSNSTAVALANGTFIEQGMDPTKQSTSSYLKEQFQAFFQPTDNKLAMKLFGSKNALLKEKRRQVQQGKWVIHPCSNFRFYWDLLMLMLLIANLIILPVAISFFNDDLSIHWIIFNSISDVVFIADIAVKFRTGVVANDFADEIILNPKEIARHYIKSWFVLDFISSIPMDYIYLIFNKKDHYNQFFSAGRTLRILRLAKLLSMLRLLRLTRLVRYVSQWEEFLNIASKFMGIFNLVLLMLLLGHWNACLQYLIPMLMEFPQDSWVKRCNLENADWFQQYTWALFKAMSHMLSIGYGRFPPTSIGEAWITIVSMMSGATCYALFVGHAAALIQSFDTSKRLYREKFKQVEEYMAYRKLPRALRQRIANYYEHRYQGKMFDEAQILNEFSECLREQVINYNCRALVAAVPFFTYADQDFVSEVVTKLKFEVFQPGDLIIKEGTIGNKMYFIQEGIVDIITKDGEVATSLSDGSYFGEICLLTNARRVASVKAVVYSNLYSLDRESFLSVLENYPLMRRTMESVAAERLNKIGQNPAIVSNREDLKEDLSLVKEIVSSAVSPEETSSGPDSENDGSQGHLNLKYLLKFGKRKRSARQNLNETSETKDGAGEDDSGERLWKQSDTDPTSDKLKLPKFMRQKRSIPNSGASTQSFSRLLKPKIVHSTYESDNPAGTESNKPTDTNDHPEDDSSHVRPQTRFKIIGSNGGEDEFPDQEPDSSRKVSLNSENRFPK